MLHELEYKKADVITAIKRNTRMLHSIILLIACTLLLLNVRFLSGVIDYIPSHSMITLLAAIAGLTLGVIYLIKKISDTAMKKLLEYSDEIDTLLIAKQQEIIERKKAEAGLTRARNALEMKVEERTADLRETNRKLEMEISERKHAEAVLEELIQQKDMFITRLGHDLKTPLTPLIGLLPLIRVQEKDPGIQNLLDACQQNARRIKDLVMKTIKLARAGSVLKERIMGNIPLMPKINDCIIRTDFIAGGKIIKFENRISPEIMVTANESDLEELLNNLISNAVKFTPEHGTVTIDAAADREKVTVSVRDTGMGLSDKHIGHIFEEFYKADESRHELDSSGLGLSICKKIVAAHGGRIWAESTGEGHGTTFYFTLKAGKP